MLSILNRVVSSVGTSIVVTNPYLPDNPIIYHNRAFEEVSGYSAEEIHGRNCRFLQGKDTDPTSVETIRRAVSEERSCIVVLRNYRKDGTAFWNELAISPIHDDQGKLTHFVGVQNDVTRRIEAEKARDTLQTTQQSIAGVLQRALLLSPPTISIHGWDIRVQHLPAGDEIPLLGGDFFDVIPLAENRVALILGDCTGKGLKATQYIAEIKYAFRIFLREDCSPTVALQRLNAFLLASQRFDIRDANALVCATVAILDTDSGTVSVAVAGMEPPLLVRENGTTESISVGDIILGVDAKAEYKAKTTCLTNQDTLILVTDGVTEARSPRPNRELFGYDRLTTVIQQATAEGLLPDAMGKRIITTAQAFTQDRLQDDACVLIARRLRGG